MFENREGKTVPQVTFRTRRAVSGESTVPQVCIDGQHIGGSEDIEAYLVEQNRQAA